MRNDPAYTKTPTIIAGISFFRKNASAQQLIGQWQDIITSDFHLIDDSPSHSPNLPKFTEHRHDQAIFSLLCKKNSVDTLSMFEHFPYKGDDHNKETWQRELGQFPIHARRDIHQSMSSLNINIYSLGIRTRMRRWGQKIAAKRKVQKDL